MRIITISREFGSGGRELGKRLADILNFDYYDSEIICAVAKNSGMDENYVGETLANHGWQDVHISFRNTLSTPSYMQSAKVHLLLEQKKVIEGIAALGKDCVIVGRNADVLLEDYDPFNIFVCAQREAKIRRCQERASEGENLSVREMARKLRQIDKVRAQTRAILSGTDWGARGGYHMTVNTTDWEIKSLAPAVADFALAWFGRNA